MRLLFVDGWNSFWHIVFGMVSIPFPIVIIPFLLYQFVLKYDGNSGIDTLEFALGYVAYMTVGYLADLKVINQFRIHL
jgi:hypothetical protein